MYRKIQATPLRQALPEAVAVVMFDQAKQLPEGYEKLDQRLGGVLSQALKRQEFSASEGSVSTLYPAASGRGIPQRVYVAGLGKEEQFTSNALRIAAARMLRAAYAARVQQLGLLVMGGLDERLSAEQAGAAVGDGVAIARFDFDRFRGAAGKKNSSPNGPAIDLKLLIEPPLRASAERALLIGESVTTARELAATPPNVAHPDYLADYCRKLAQRVGLKCTLIRESQAKRLGMGGLLAVGGGGSRDPVLICLEWPGARTRRARATKTRSRTRASAAPILLVGKAVTFDTGGYSLKPPQAMTGMKYDKSGGTAVIGIMEAVARLKLPVPVVGLIPAVENMIDDDAYRVDDIIRFANGVTAEITNTDAEGRLILADALAYGTQRYRPRAVLDFATLTGGVVVALGSFCAGLFCNDDDLRQRIQRAADFTGERVWELPLWHEHRQLIRGTHADLVNAGEREAHPIQGAAFLSHFVGSDAPTRLPTIPWAHFDIAGVADARKDTPLYPKGPTGYGVRLTVELLSQWKG